MRVRLSFFLIIAVLVLLCACATENANANVTRDEAIQIVRNISGGASDMDIDSYPDMDKVVDNVRYYFIKVVYANRMTAAYFVDENAGNVYIAMGGELDTENLLEVTGLDEEASDVTEITVTETADIKDIFDAIGMTEQQVEQKFGKDYKTVSVNYDEYMEGFFYSERGFTIAFGSDGMVARVYCTEKIDINGARSGMDFSQIQETLGETVFRQTWAETPVNTAYEIEYRYNGRTVVFFSRQKEGSNSIMSIS